MDSRLDEDDDRLTATDLYEDLVELDGELRELVRRADDRDAQQEAMFAINHMAGLKLPTGVGSDIDRALIKPKAAATLLIRSMHRARKNVPTLPADLDDLVRCIDRLLKAILAARAETEWVARSTPSGRLPD
jgi:hypothetical protein